MIRRLLPYALLPLSILACGLASAPWLRAYPASVMAVPLFGAAILSVLIPLVVVGIGIRRLWLTCLIDLVLFVFYELLVTLRDPGAFTDLYDGLVHGPSQILSFALPLVSPRTLLIAPVALCWLTGAIVGECLARGWHSVVPSFTLLVSFGLSYAATIRAVTDYSNGRRYDALLAGSLLLVLLLLRAVHAWVSQEESAEITQPDGVLPLRGLATGAVVSVLIAVAASLAVQSSAFSGQAEQLSRVPPLDQSQPVTPVAFVSGLRPSDPDARGQVLFRLTTNRPSPRYVALATLDYYDGDGWSFDRTFLPSGGVLPEASDPALVPATKPVEQQFTIQDGALTTVPWMPYLERARKITGIAVNIDADSGMIVPAHRLRAGQSYTVRSRVPSKTFLQLDRRTQLAAGEPVDTTIANGLREPLQTLIDSLTSETGVSSSQTIPFLQAVAKQFRTRGSLSGYSLPPSKTSSATPHRTGTAGGHGPTGTPSATPSTAQHTGGTSFADVLASIRSAHAATPEQYATLLALVARQLNVPARLVTGFRIPVSEAATGDANTYNVTTADSWTWVEIPVVGEGWVVLDPSPKTLAGQQPPQTAHAESTPSPTPSPTPNALLTQANNGGNAVAPKSSVPGSDSTSATAVVVIVAIVVAGLLLLLLGALLLGKRLRNSRRRRLADPRRRLLGAWQEALDMLTESGLPDPSTMTSAEVVGATTRRFGGESALHVRYLGDAANVAIFNPVAPIGAAEADAAWRTHSRLRRSLRRSLTRRGRLGARLRYRSGAHERRPSRAARAR